jgi:plastocyanin
MIDRNPILAALAGAGLLALSFACGGADQPADPAESGAAPAPAAGELTRVDPAIAATISGVVKFAGEQPRVRPINMGADEDCKALHDGPVMPDSMVVNDNSTLKYVFVWVKKGLEGKAFETPKTPGHLDQIGCIYRPHVLGVMVGQTLHVTNSDPTLHNVHPLPRVNLEWNKSQAAGAGPIVETFSKPELMIPVKCNIHPWMRSYISVVEHPFFAVTGDDGEFTIEGLPPGNYTLEAVHERLGNQEIEVTAGESETKTVEFQFQT